MPRCAWRCHMTNFSNSSAGIPPLYPAALKRSADVWRVAPDRLERNRTARDLHSVDGAVEKNARATSKMRHAKVRASSAGILQEHRQASVPGDGASSFFGGCGKSRYRAMKLSHARLRSGHRGLTANRASLYAFRQLLSRLRSGLRVAVSILRDTPGCVAAGRLRLETKLTL